MLLDMTEFKSNYLIYKPCVHVHAQNGTFTNLYLNMWLYLTMIK